MAERLRGEGEKERTPEEIFEGALRAKVAVSPLVPEEIERLIRDLGKEGINPDVGKVVRKMLKDRISRNSDHRDIITLIVFCKLHAIPYTDDYSAQELRRIKITYNYGVEPWMNLLSKK